MTREAFENAMVIVAALGGSTNAVLHLIAMARSVNVPLTIDDFQKISDKTPLLADFKPSGPYVMEDLQAVGGLPGVMKMLLAERLLHGDCVTVTGKTTALSVLGADDGPDQRADGHARDLSAVDRGEGATASFTQRTTMKNLATDATDQRTRTLHLRGRGETRGPRGRCHPSQSEVDSS